MSGGGAPLDGGSDASTPDGGGGRDAGGGDTDGGGGEDGGDIPLVPRSLQFQSSGGGTAESSTYRLRLGVGAPVPLGEAESASHRAVTGPSAARP